MRIHVGLRVQIRLAISAGLAGLYNERQLTLTAGTVTVNCNTVRRYSDCCHRGHCHCLDINISSCLLNATVAQDNDGLSDTAVHRPLTRTIDQAASGLHEFCCPRGMDGLHCSRRSSFSLRQ